MDGLSERIEQILRRLRPALRADGGDVELVSVLEQVVRIRLRGIYHKSGADARTVQAGIERAIKSELPEIARVESVD